MQSGNSYQRTKELKHVALLRKQHFFDSAGLSCQIATSDHCSSVSMLRGDQRWETDCHQNQGNVTVVLLF